MKSSEGSHKMGTLGSLEYNEQAIRDALIKFIILDELPFKLVEGIGFIYFMSQRSLDFVSRPVEQSKGIVMSCIGERRPI